MAGVPHHAVESYIARLIEKGYHVAVCEQITEPNGRGLVEREVTRVITPGTVIEPELLSEDKPNYLMAIYPLGDLDVWERGQPPDSPMPTSRRANSPSPSLKAITLACSSSKNWRASPRARSSCPPPGSSAA